ncbi:MAG TPA: SDR family oxidoreductase [Aggregatilineaceae bacterium]|nr:SDR family oxidoreductase [Aggregatilineaceae bacterium]
MDGRICIVTGANSGIGKATAAGLAQQDATVVMVCRDQKRGVAARDDIVSASGSTSVDLLVADLSSQQSIRQLAEEFKRKYQQLHVLVNNAGVFHSQRSVTADGLEYTFALNHLAYFLLTSLLLDVLTASAPSRIVNLTSGAERAGKIDFDDLQGEQRFKGTRAYSQSKLANVLFTYELARRLQGTHVTVNCVQPGAVRTNFGRDATGLFGLSVRILTPLMKPPEQGAETPIYLATAPEIEGVSGKCFIGKKQVQTSRRSYDETVARHLWEVSEKLSHVAQESGLLDRQ